MLEKELVKFKEIQDHLLVDNPNGGFVVIKDDEVIGVFNDRGDALKIGIEKFGDVPFLVKNINDGANGTEDVINFSRHIQFA